MKHLKSYKLFEINWWDEGDLDSKDINQEYENEYDKISPYIDNYNAKYHTAIKIPLEKWEEFINRLSMIRDLSGNTVEWYNGLSLKYKKPLLSGGYYYVFLVYPLNKGLNPTNPFDTKIKKVVLYDEIFKEI